MKYIKTILTSLLLILCINASSVANEGDWMPDANLRAAVQTALGLGNADTLTKEAMTNLTQLSAERSNIANITGLEHATNLTDLQLPFNQITDISPLRTLTHLTNLVLDNNPIGDITALGNLTDLKILQVKNCGITDVSPLLMLVNLTTLRIALNDLTNISPLRTLTHLTNLALDNNPIGDITALGNLTDLKILQVKNCGITDVSPLLTLVNLTTLRIAVNDLTNAHLLSTLTNLKDIDITIPDPPPPPDVDPPGVSLTIPSVVQNGAFSVTITFTESVSGFTESDLSLSGTATASITAWRTTNNTTYIADNTIYTADSTTYTATITPTTGGTVILNVAPNVATDPADNPNTAAETKTVNVDVDRPTVTISVPSGTQTGAFNTTITFSETVSDFAQSDVSLTGSAASITAWNANDNKTVYTATITPTASGTVTINVAANVATDAANNPNTAATSQTVTVSLDTSPPGDTDAPSVSISVPSDVQNGAFDATITFTEVVSGFTQSDLSLSGTATASITAWNTTDNITYTATITPTTSGTVIFNIEAGVATDAANNPNTAATSQTVTVSLDTSPPVDTDAPSVSISVPSVVQNGAFDATITFTEVVSGFAQSDLSLSGTATASITAWNTTDNTVYTATITPTTSGTVVFNIEAGVATDAADNPNTAATAKTVNVDIDKPTVTIGVPSGTQTGAFDATITFSETVSDFAQSDVSLTGSAASITAWNANDNKTVYTATITPTASGTVTISVAANVATDAANNPNTAATSQTVTVSLDTPPPRDTDAPSVSISAPSDVQNGAFSVTITFTEVVSDFVQADLSLTGTATASITAWNTTDNITYTATITPTTSGTVIFSIEAGVATDAADNPNTAAETKTVNVDVDRPTVTIGVPSGTQTGAFDATITFSETVSDFAQSDVSLTGAAASITTWSANANNTIYTATITPTASGTVTINVAADVATDAAGNNNTAATAKTVTVTILGRDTTAPSVSITAPSAVQNGAFSVTITFTEVVSDFVQADLSLTGTATASITAWNTTDNITYTATITPTNSGTVIFNIEAGVATDAADNPNTAATAKTVTVDVDAPSVSISVPSDAQNGAFDTTITFTEPVSGFAQSDVALTGSAASITAWSANDNKTVYTATITPTASGTVTISVAANVATDAANNPNTAATPKTVTVDVDAPSVSISVPSDNQTGAFDATITFTEPVSGFGQADVRLSGTATATITAWSANNNKTVYTATITPTASGTVTISVAANVATDAANNPNTAATPKTVTVDVDTTPPSMSFSFDIREQPGTPVSYITNGPFTMTITFTEPVTGFEQSDFEVDRDYTLTDFKVIEPETIDTVTYADTYTIRVIPDPNRERLYIDFHFPTGVATDAAGNPSDFANSPDIDVEKQRPRPVISIPDSTVETATFTIEITFDRGHARPLGFEQSDVSLTNNTAGATITKWTDKLTGVFEAEITVTRSGSVTFRVPENVATDLAGNGNTAALQKTVTITLPGSEPPEPPDVDTTPPSMSFSFDIREQPGTPVSYITNGPFTMTITFTEPVTGFEQSDFEVDRDYTLTDFKVIEPETIDTVTYADTYTIRVIPDPNRERLYIDFHFPTGVATDAAGNPSDFANSPDIDVEKQRPQPVISVPDSTVETATFTIEITFDRGHARPLGFEQSDVSLANNTAGATITKWTDKLTGVFEAEITVTQSGSVTFRVPENVATDLAGNGNTAALQKTVTITLTDNQGDAPFANGHITDSPSETLLLSNYPNPFNPETWIPYHLADPGDVRITIYDMKGHVVKRLELGHQPAGFYTNRGRAAYWNGRNAVGEKVVSGVYFYTLTAGDFAATRKMLILK